MIANTDCVAIPNTIFFENTLYAKSIQYSLETKYRLVIFPVCHLSSSFYLVPRKTKAAVDFARDIECILV
jgi:hypothetical protein